MCFCPFFFVCVCVLFFLWVESQERSDPYVIVKVGDLQRRLPSGGMDQFEQHKFHRAAQDPDHRQRFEPRLEGLGHMVTREIGQFRRLAWILVIYIHISYISLRLFLPIFVDYVDWSDLCWLYLSIYLPTCLSMSIYIYIYTHIITQTHTHTHTYTYYIYIYIYISINISACLWIVSIRESIPFSKALATLEGWQSLHLLGERRGRHAGTGGANNISRCIYDDVKQCKNTHTHIYNYINIYNMYI